VEYYVYIIYSSSRDKYYTGFSQNPEERLIEHNLGATTSTGTGKPLTLVYREKCIIKTTAIKKENQIKNIKPPCICIHKHNNIIINYMEVPSYH
jgi:putative endonuclease